MKSTIVKILALVLAMVMTVFVAGCGEDEVEIVYQYEDESQTTSVDDGAEASKNESVASNNASTSSTKKPGSKVESVVNDNVNPADYRNTTITYATWRNPKQYEDGPVVAAFEKKYGIKVKVDLMTESEYTQKVVANISSGNSPDIYFSTYTFPYCIKALQPIDAAKLNLKEPIWDKSLIDIATVNGKTYLVDTVGNIWKDEDMVFYNKKIFRDNGITTPEQYQAAGKWTFETMEKCMKEVAALGTKYVGGAIHLEGLIHSAGGSVIGLKNGKFYNGTQNAVTQKVMQWASTGLKEGWLSTTSIYTALNEFPSGNVGVAILHSFGLKKTGYLRNMKASDIGFTYLPSWEQNQYTPTSFVRGWGLCTGAKNPVAAGIFLRYYLDVNNYDTGSAFISKEAENFFFKLTSTATQNKNFYFCYGSGVNGVTGKESAVGDYISTPAHGDPLQVIPTIKAYQGQIEADIAKLNDILK
ncbi:MAG: extracellular solute-binding protein [Clostridia bacterium]|nr:extracellular solute-binding protein [Clostridia bacterium]